MMILGVVAGLIAAIGTVTAGTIKLVKWILDLGRRAERERAEQARMAADLEIFRKQQILDLDRRVEEKRAEQARVKAELEDLRRRLPKE